MWLCGELDCKPKLHDVAVARQVLRCTEPRGFSSCSHQRRAWPRRRRFRLVSACPQNRQATGSSTDANGSGVFFWPQAPPPPVRLACRAATAGGGEAAAAEAARLMSAEQHRCAAVKLEESISMEADPLRALQSRLNLGCVLTNLSEQGRAVEILRDCLLRISALEPRFALTPHPATRHLQNIKRIAHVNLGCALKGDQTAQMQHFEEALRLDPTCVETLFHTAASAWEAGRVDWAVSLIERTLTLAPGNVRCMGLACKCFMAQGRRQEAISLCERICSIDVASTYVALREIFECRNGDVFVCTYPRCGTTWMVQLVVCILHGPQADYDAHASFVEGGIASRASFVWDLERMVWPRILKMHVPADMYPGLARGSDVELQVHGKAICVVRNPKDALVSLRHHHANNASIGFKGSWDEWIDSWLAGERSMEYGGSYFDHVRGWWRLSRCHPDRVLLIYFEDMREDLVSVASAVASFLGCDLSPDRAQSVAERCGFEAMRGRYRVEEAVRTRVNAEHFRKGEVGAWREALSDAQAARVDAATRRQLGQEMAQGLRLRDS